MTEAKKSNGWSWDERREIVREFHDSGQTQRAFCRQWGVTPSTLRNWCRRVGEDESGDDSASGEHRPARVLPVQLQDHEPAREQASIRLVTRSGRHIEVSAGFDAATLQRLLATLEAGR